MKKSFVLLLLIAAFISAKAEFTPIAQWKLFTGTYAYIDSKVDKNINFSGGEDVAAFTENNVGTMIFAVNGKGIFSFDGKSMENLVMPKECFAAQGFITSMACDSKNTIWIGTTKGLVKLENNLFSNIGSEETKLQVITDITITATDKVYISGLNASEKIYVGGGVSFYNGTTWVNYNTTNSEIPDNLMSNLIVDETGFLWAIPGKNDMGVVKFDGKVWKSINTENGLPTNSINTIAMDSKGTIHLGSPKGIIVNELPNWKMMAFSNSFSPKLSEFLTKSQDGASIDVNAIAIENNGTIWVGTKNQGLFSFSQGGVKLLQQSNSALISNAVNKIFIDKNSNKWILAGYKNPNFAQYALHDSKNGNRTQYTIGSGGVTVYKEHGMINNPKYTVYDSTTAPIDISTILGIDEDIDHNIWFTNTSEGLVKLNNNTFEKFTTSNIFHSSFSSLYLAPDNKIYLSASMGGVKVFENGKINDFAKNPNMGGVNNITYDENNTVWVSGSGGISHYVENSWETFNKRDGLPSMIFYCIFKDSKNTLWAGSAKGLVKYDSTWQVVGKEVKFASDDFRDIAEDETGKLWLGSNKGIAIYDGNNFTLMPNIESLNIKNFLVNKISIANSNDVWVGTSSYGALHFDGTNWTPYDKTTTQGAVLNKVTAIKIASDGKLYIASVSSDFGISSYELPTQDPFEIIKREIVKKIKLSEPKNFLTIIQTK